MLWALLLCTEKVLQAFGACKQKRRDMPTDLKNTPLSSTALAVFCILPS